MGPDVAELATPASRLARYRTDYLLMTCAAIALVLLILALTDVAPMGSPLGRAAHTVHEMLGAMWWGGAQAPDRSWHFSSPARGTQSR